MAKRNQTFNIDTVAEGNDPAKIFRGIVPKLPNGRSGFQHLKREMSNGLDAWALPGMMGYGMRELTDATSRIETVPLMLEQILGEDWKATKNRFVSVEEQSDSVGAAPNLPTNANPPVETRATRFMIPFEIPRFAIQFDVSPEDVENVRAFATMADQQSLEQVIMELLAKSLNRLKVAEELMRRGSLDGVQRVVNVKGEIKDIFNYYTARTAAGAQSAPIAANLKLSAGAGNDVSNQLLKMKRVAERKVQMQGVSSWAVLASSDVYDAIVTHPSVVEKYLNWQNATQLFDDNRLGGFRFNGNQELFDMGNQILPSISGGEPYKMWPDGTLKVVPVGTTAARNAPIIHEDAIGKDGRPAYVTPEKKKFGKGYEFLVESQYVAWNKQLEAITNATIT